MAKSSIKLPPVPPNLDELVAKLVREALAVADNAPKTFPPPMAGSAVRTAMPPPPPPSALRQAATEAVQGTPKAPKVPKPPKAPKELGPTNPDSVRMIYGKEKWDATYTIFVDSGMPKGDAKSATNRAMTMAARADKEAVDKPVRDAANLAKSNKTKADYAVGNDYKKMMAGVRKEERDAKKLAEREAADIAAQAAGTRAAPANAPKVRRKPKGYQGPR